MLAAKPGVEGHAGEADDRDQVSGLESADVAQSMPITLVSAAPPRIAITRSEPAVLVLSPMPLSPNAKMVGNMIDMKKLVVSTQQTPANWAEDADKAEHHVDTA